MASTQDGGDQASYKRQLALSWSEEEIISVYEQQPIWKPNGFSTTGFVFPPENPVAYIKFGFHQGMAELRNHEYALKALKDMPPDQTQGIIIPEIYRTFENGNLLFAVMEYIPGKTLAELVKEPGWDSQKTAHSNDIARAIKLLMSIEPPPGQTPGPVGGGRIRHPLFKDCESYCRYSSVDELEAHLNKVARLRIKDAPLVRLERDLCFYYSDFYANNFIFTDSGDLCIIDFDQAGFLPQSFMMFAMRESHWYPGHWIKDILKLPEDNLAAMKNIVYWFAIGVSDLGVWESREERDAYRRNRSNRGQEPLEYKSSK